MCGVQEIENSVKSRMREMLGKMKPGKTYSQSEIDVYGSVDAQAFARLLNEGKIEFIKGQQVVQLTTGG